IKNHVGPLFAQAKIKTKLQVSDAGLLAWAARDLPTILDDAEARKYISSMSYHGYDFVFKEAAKDISPRDTSSDRLMQLVRQESPTAENGYDFAEFRYAAELVKKYPELPLWMTEVCYADGTPDQKNWSRPLPRY